ncbi:MAG: hypothetical protein RL684_1892 [Pseudomonadota bacterium]
MDWYRGFGSSELDALLQSAATDNLDVAVATARVRQAAARAKGAHATLLPQVGVSGVVSHFTGSSNGNSASETDWSALLSASYEVDFWGRNRASARSAAASAVASAADRDTVLLTTRAAVASSFFTILSLRERRAVAEQDLATAREVLRVIEARHDGGAASAAEVASQRAAVATASVSIPELRGQEYAALVSLAVLTGRDPEGFDVPGNTLQGIYEPDVAAGLPADLLVRRPDIASAEATLVAANADLVAARAAFFPSIALTANGGVQSPAMQAAVTTLAGTGPTLAVGASLLQSIFDAGRHRALRDEAAARADEMLVVYRSAIRNALLDVESALAARHSLQDQQAARAEAVAQSELAFEGARARYAAGSGDYLSLLDAQRSLHALHDADAQYRLSRLQGVVVLAKALGGGWQTDTKTTTN